MKLTPADCIRLVEKLTSLNEDKKVFEAKPIGARRLRDEVPLRKLTSLCSCLVGVIAREIRFDPYPEAPREMTEEEFQNFLRTAQEFVAVFKK
jgi:hypothetical protein